MAREKILIVDDDVTLLEMLKRRVASYGFEPVTAVDGQEAVSKLAEEAFSIVLTDMVMPKMDGMELLKHIRENYPGVDVIVLTGFHDTFSYVDVVKAGASDFIVKPFRSDELEAKINRVTREQRLIRKLKEVTGNSDVE